MALDVLANYNYLKDMEYPYDEATNEKLFKAMDHKYYRDNNGNVQKGDPNNEIDRRAFKAFAPEYLKMERVGEKEIREQMRARDYDYVHSVDPDVQSATYDYEELKWYTNMYREELKEWMAYPIGLMKEGKADDIDFEDFRRRVTDELMRRADPELRNVDVIPEDAYYRVFNRLDENKNGRIDFYGDKFRQSQGHQTTWIMFMELY